jgi:antitoxin component of MazEF toxin-antitoxin module
VRKWGSLASGRSNAIWVAAARAHRQAAKLQAAGRIVNEPTWKATYDLATLVAGITDENRHELQDAGLCVGREVW